MSRNYKEDALSEETKAMYMSKPDPFTLATSNISGYLDSYRAAPYNKRQSRLPLSAGVHRLTPIPEEPGVPQTIREEKSDTRAVRMLELTDFVVDITILEAIRRENPMVARAVEYDCEICDGELLPLARLEQMMSGDGERPPIKVARCGRMYKVLDGRHRLARSFLIQQHKIAAIVMNDGHDSYILAGGESNPGPEEANLIAPKPSRIPVPKNRVTLYEKRYRKSSIPQIKTSDNVGEDHTNISATSPISGDNVSVRNPSGKRNYRTRKNRKGYRNGNYRKDRIELDIPVVLPKEEFDSKYLAKLIANGLPSREDLEIRFRAANLNVVYQCPCGINNYGFPKACGCSFKDQVIAMYNNIVARELQVIACEEPEKALSDIILEKELVVDEIKSVESAVRNEASNFKTNPELDTIQSVSQVKQTTVTATPNTSNQVKGTSMIPNSVNNLGQVGAASDVIVRKRRGIYRLLKTPGIFNFDARFNHHHESISKTKDQSSNNRLVISDEFVNEELYNYLRRNEFDTYPDRATKLSHMTKLAAKWEGKDFKLSNQGKNLCPRELNKYWVTIQKVTDAKDTEFLLSEVKAYHTNSRFKRFLGKLGCYPKYLN